MLTVVEEQLIDGLSVLQKATQKLHSYFLKLFSKRECLCVHTMCWPLEFQHLVSIYAVLMLGCCFVVLLSWGRGWSLSSWSDLRKLLFGVFWKAPYSFFCEAFSTIPLFFPFFIMRLYSCFGF